MPITVNSYRLPACAQGMAVAGRIQVKNNVNRALPDTCPLVCSRAEVGIHPDRTKYKCTWRLTFQVKRGRARPAGLSPRATEKERRLLSQAMKEHLDQALHITVIDLMLTSSSMMKVEVLET